MDDWSIVIAVFSLFVAVAGVGTAIWSLIRGGKANEFAKNAVEVARAANEFATVANDLSRESNGIAVSAKDLAEEANTFSRRAEALETERHDVAWEGSWEGPGRWAFTNLGDDEALDVRATLTVNGERSEARADCVPAGGHIVLELPGAREELAKENRKMRRLKARGHESGSRMFPDYGLQADLHSAEMVRSMHAFEERLVWVSQLGRQRTYGPEAYLGSLSND